VICSCNYLLSLHTAVQLGHLGHRSTHAPGAQKRLPGCRFESPRAMQSTTTPFAAQLPSKSVPFNRLQRCAGTLRKLIYLSSAVLSRARCNDATMQPDAKLRPAAGAAFWSSTPCPGRVMTWYGCPCLARSHCLTLKAGRRILLSSWTSDSS
jgi:hypothetical protein